MPVGSPLADLAAWVGLGALLYLTALGLGLLVERVARLRLPSALLPPLGFCAAIVAVVPVYELGFGATVAAPLLALAALAGLVLARRELRERVNPGWAGLAALAVYALYIAPFALTGGFTWGGYNFLNDSAVQMLLADHLQQHGARSVDPAASTANATVDVYLATEYPLGTQAHLGTLAWLLGVPVAVIYQSYIAAAAAMAAMGLTAIARRAGFAGGAAAAVAFAALAANLTFQFGLQGSIKEIGMLATLAIAAALGRELLDGAAAKKGSVPFLSRAKTGTEPFLSSGSAPALAGAVAIALAAGMLVYSVAAGPYVLALALALLAATFLDPRGGLRGTRLKAAAVGAAVFVVAALPALLSLRTFLDVARPTFGVDASVTGSVLGQLARPLKVVQVGGVWLEGQYSGPIESSGLKLLTGVAIAAIGGLLLLGLVRLVRDREPGPLLLLTPVVAVAAVVGAQVVPYGDAKLLAIASPAVVLCAACGLLGLGRRLRGPAVALGVALLGAILLSDALGYHDVQLAPTERLAALEDVGDWLEGRPGIALVNESEELGKYLTAGARTNFPTDAISPLPIALRENRVFYSSYYDLEEQRPDYLQRFAYIVQRRSAAAGRPPANYAPAYGNRFYVVWRRAPRPLVREHIPLERLDEATAVPRCSDVAALAARAAPGEVLIAAERPPLPRLDVARTAARPPSWRTDPTRPGLVRAGKAGRVRGTVAIEGAVPGTAGGGRPGVVPTASRYRVWVRGSFGRPLEVRVDGRRVGSVEGIDTFGQWRQAGTVTLAEGAHTIEVRRPGASLAPGDGAPTYVGPVALEPVTAPRLRRVEPRRARALCGKPLDWIELVAP